MCGRFTLSRQDAERIALELGVPVESLSDYQPRYNIAPTDMHWILRMKYENRELLPARWGLINSWAKDGKRGQINARGETLAERPAFREAFKRRRCVVPADGFFEWAGPKGARQPFWFHRPDGGLLLLAGLHESWQPEPSTWERTFTVVTTEPNADVSPIHNRMPVILPEDRVDDWLYSRHEDLDGLAELLSPAVDGLLKARPLSTRVNNVKNDDAAVLEEVAAPPF